MNLDDFDSIDPFEPDDLTPRTRKVRHQHVQPVTIEQKTKGPWSGNPQLGYRFPFAMDDNFRQTLLKLDEWGPPEVWTVMLGLEYSEDEWPASPPAANFLEITGEIQVGSGGATQQFEVDWIQGTCFSVPMNAINIAARYSVSAQASVPADLSLVVLLARGARGSSLRPKHTRFELVAAGAATAYHRVPNFCHRIQLLPSDLVSATSLYNPNSYLNFAPAPVPTMGFGFVLGSQLLNFPDGVPVPGYSRNVRFVNGSLNGVRLNWLFHLQL